jgi:hypothetical protein
MKQLFIIIFFFCFSAIYAQNVDDVVNQHIQALGGKEKLNTLKTIQLKGILFPELANIPVTVTKEHLRLFRQESKNNDAGRSLLLVKKDMGYIVNPLNRNELRKMDSEELSCYQNFLDIQSPFLDYKIKGTKIEYNGMDMVNDTACVVLKCNFQNGLTVKYSLSITTFLVMRMYYKIPYMGQQIEGICDFSDYKKVDGFYVAHKETYRGMQMGEIAYSEIKINAVILPSLYNPN